MNNYFRNILITVAALFAIGLSPMMASDAPEQEIDVKGFIMEHLADSYEWHITTMGETHVSIPLPIIVIGETSGFNVFMSSKFEHGHKEYNGFYIATSGDYKGKIVETNAAGEEVRPLDFSITKNALGLLINCSLLIFLILSVASWYKKQGQDGNHKTPKGFVGGMEMFIMSIVDDVIKPSIGKDYRKYTPYLLTAFFFIFLNNIMGLIPIFPAGANTTGNIAITLVLALFTFFTVNFNGTREYWKEIFWPDVPHWLKPLMIPIEIVGMFTKPFSLMVRLFANILAGHSIILGLTCLIFVTVTLGAAMNGIMMGVSVILSVFIMFVEILVAFIQAYVFTMLSSIYIGMARVEPHHHAEKK